jgi:hypothetical protein
MKKIKLLFAILFSLTLLVSCKSKKEEIKEKLKKEFKASKYYDDNKMVIISVEIIKKTENEYYAKIKTTEGGEEYLYKFDVVYDGENLDWVVIR